MSYVFIQEKSDGGGTQVIPRAAGQSTGQIVNDARAAVRIATRDAGKADDSVAVPVTSGTSVQAMQAVAVRASGGGTEYIRFRD